MADETVKRVVAEAALAKRFESEINERASLADIPALVEAVETLDTTLEEGIPQPAAASIAIDTDGVPYFIIGE